MLTGGRPHSKLKCVSKTAGGLLGCKIHPQSKTLIEAALMKVNVVHRSPNNLQKHLQLIITTSEVGLTYTDAREHL